VAVPVLRGDDVVAAAITVSPTNQLRRRLAVKLGTLIAADLAAIAIFILLSDRAAIWVLRPVYRLDTAARQISTGNLAARVDHRGGPVEIRRLAGSFNRMAEAVETAMERQTTFVADASHQLRNPLAALTLRLEELRAELPQRCMPAVADVLDEASRLRGILDELLHLASVQEVATSAQAPTDMVDMLAGRIQTWRPLAQLKCITLAYKHPASAFAQVDPTLISSVLDAVIDNGIKFGQDGGQVAIEVTVECSRVRVDVADDGVGVAPDEMDRLGDRFWRSPSKQNVPGSGLGLSIARTLAELNGGSLQFTPNEPTGLRVSLYLPVPPPPATTPVPVARCWPRRHRRSSRRRDRSAGA
jgi:signal transduction histidine kinase